MDIEKEIDLNEEKDKKILTVRKKIFYLILALGGIGLSILAIIMCWPYFILMGGAY